MWVCVGVYSHLGVNEMHMTGDGESVFVCVCVCVGGGDQHRRPYHQNLQAPPPPHTHSFLALTDQNGQLLQPFRVGHMAQPEARKQHISDGRDRRVRGRRVAGQWVGSFPHSPYMYPLGLLLRRAAAPCGVHAQGHLLAAMLLRLHGHRIWR